MLIICVKGKMDKIQSKWSLYVTQPAKIVTIYLPISLCLSYNWQSSNHIYIFSTENKFVDIILIFVNKIPTVSLKLSINCN